MMVKRKHIEAVRACEGNSANVFFRERESLEFIFSMLSARNSLKAELQRLRNRRFVVRKTT
jgi:hypothetical protein